LRGQCGVGDRRPHGGGGDIELGTLREQVIRKVFAREEYTFYISLYFCIILSYFYEPR